MIPCAEAFVSYIHIPLAAPDVSQLFLSAHMLFILFYSSLKP